MKTLIGSHLETSGNPSKRFVEKQRIRGRTHLKGGGSHVRVSEERGLRVEGGG